VLAIIKEGTTSSELTQQGLFAELEVIGGAVRKIQEITTSFVAPPRGIERGHSGTFAAQPLPLPEPQAPTAPAASIIPEAELAMVRGASPRSTAPPLHRYPVSLERAAQNAKRSAALHLGRAQVVLALSGCPQVLADERKLEQVFVNLIQNAAQAMPVDRSPTENQIRVSARQSEGWIWVEVADNGIGIPEDEQRILFTPFYTTKAEGVGTGLGLVNCRDLLREFGGDISLKSKPGQGTVATLALEVVPSLSGSPSPIQRPRLVVLASERVASLWSEYLYNRHEIITAETPDAALAHVRERPAALVLCDVSPASGDVVEFYQKAVNFSPSLKGRFLFVVGTPSERVRRFLEDVNETRLAKPLSAEQARRAVLAALGESELTP
jgi:anti-sigma regulatory factor (Ser/Thr protein kinase)